MTLLPQKTIIRLSMFSNLIWIEIGPNKEMLQTQVSFRLLLLHDTHCLCLPQNGTGSVQLSKLNHFQYNLRRISKTL